MVELTLPRNSKIKPGKTWPKPEGATNLREYKIYRWSPDDDENPRLDTYYVDLDDCGPMVLDGLLWIMEKVGFRDVQVLPVPEDGYEQLRHGKRVMVAGYA